MSCCLQELEQGQAQAQHAQQQLAEQQGFRHRIEADTQTAQSKISQLQQQLAEAGTSLAAAEAAWATERTRLEAANRDAAAEAAAADTQQQVEAALSGKTTFC